MSRSKISELSDKLSEAELNVANKVNYAMERHLIELEPGDVTAALHIELAARQLSVALAFADDYLKKNNADDLVSGDDEVIELCVARAQEIRRDDKQVQ
jgi:hypothetical protein